MAAAAATLIRMEVAALLASIPLVWIALVLPVKRLHDVDVSGWHSLWMGALAPVANATGGAVETVLDLCGYGLFAWMCLTPGSSGPNRFGAAPAPIPAAANTGTASD